MDKLTESQADTLLRIARGDGDTAKHADALALVERGLVAATVPGYSYPPWPSHIDYGLTTLGHVTLHALREQGRV